MSDLKTRIEDSRDRMVDGLLDMSPRDRNLLLGLVVAAILAIVIGSSWWMNSRIDALRSRVDSRTDTLQMIRVMAEDHHTAIGKAEEIEARLKNSSGTDLSSFLEQTANKANIRDRLDAVREKSAATDGVLEEKIFSVKLSKLTLEDLSSFLYEAETAGYPMRVINMKIKTKKKGDDKLLQVDLDIAAYRVIEAEPTAAQETEG